ncbi:alpha/beta hydrolase [Nocardioides sp. CER19]|uniref:alpha/beta hydrolase n=1 Tax=Nocardioides sp. CER19 TaxID=3038538 RepID=UPI002447096F|nr:alpha/beta hydrolase [Nocardioides sp. CER19]MDH2413845.1 alpha/beta fold hydrolase [Nocardioides sp. CER19]
MDPVDPSRLVVAVGDRVVPAVLWRAPGGAAPLVLLGHGGSGHKTAPRQTSIANRLVAAGLDVIAIDGPAHGERAHPSTTPGAYQTDLVTRGFTSVGRDMVADWIAAIDAASEVRGTDGRLGYLGLSMGTRFGLPLAAELGERLTCAVFGKFGLEQSDALHPGLHDAAQLRRDAARVSASTLWHVQWHDELFPLAGQLEIFDILGSTAKHLVAYPGEHGVTPDEAVDHWTTFLIRRLAAADAG